MNKPVLIVVDDDKSFLNLVVGVGETIGYKVQRAVDGRAFEEAWLAERPDVIVMDLIMPGVEGIELLTWLAKQGCRAPIILVSGYDGNYLKIAQNYGRSIGSNIVGALCKPFEISDLEDLLRATLKSVT